MKCRAQMSILKIMVVNQQRKEPNKVFLMNKNFTQKLKDLNNLQCGKVKTKLKSAQTIMMTQFQEI